MSISLIFGGFGFRDHCFTVEAFTNPTPTPAAGVSYKEITCLKNHRKISKYNDRHQITQFNPKMS
jgi:hypothetical protein